MRSRFKAFLESLIRKKEGREGRRGEGRSEEREGRKKDSQPASQIRDHILRTTKDKSNTNLLIVQWIINGIGQRGDKIWLCNQRRTLLNQKLSLQK